MRAFAHKLQPHVTIAALLSLGLFTGCAADTSESPADPHTGEETTIGPSDKPENDSTLDDEETLHESSVEPVGEFHRGPQQSEDWPEPGDTQGIYPVEVRAANHQDFERIVIEHAGSGTPRYLAQYTNEPMEPGIGTPVDTGDAEYLEIVVTGTASIDEIDEDQMLEHGTEITDFETQATGTVVSFAPWEATSHYIIGLDQQRPYAITILENPVRLVIDIQLGDDF